ncbi:C45 family peptidase [Flammeovirga sp. OC4]|uniref:C45 family autoproteolytic acyltransferase/hydolase n=1 Tax=Flammeovirga sp. OC4 TaxID=1382345 RepID=UPI0005C47337|nr:C45 family peptidase [Flammeovirga sp. OC4]
MKNLKSYLSIVLGFIFSFNAIAQNPVDVENNLSDLNLKKEYKGGKLYEANGFLIPVIEGSNEEMGEQYGALMKDEMQKIYDALVKKEIEEGKLDQETIQFWTDRAYGSGSLRTKQFYEGVAKGADWSLTDVIFLDQVMEFGIYYGKLHSFAGCTSIASWGEQSKDGEMYIGRNMDWSESFLNFPTVLTVRKPNDGSYKMATTGWAGMYAAFTAMNEKGVYLDVHDGTSMGGSLVYKERPSILNTMVDIVSESPSLEAVKARFNGINNSVSIIFTIADSNSAASVEASSLAGNRVRTPKNDALTVVNTFLADDWGLGTRETVSNSLRRYSNMQDRLAETKGQVDAQMTKDLMDIRLFNEDDSFKENGGCTKPELQDADITVYQTVFDIHNQKVYLKVPVAEYFADWTEINLNELWK